MSTVQELSILHRRYADISHRFRAAWTFHQFVQSLGKTLLHRPEDGRAAEFQKLYTELKEISQNLNASESERIRGRLEAIDRLISDVIAELAQEDIRLTPELLRQFFRRVKGYDEKILTQLVKFYLYAPHEDPWHPDRIDKVDFLLARLSEEEGETGEPVLRDPRRLSEIFHGLWALLGAEAPPALVEQRRWEIEAIRSEVGRIESLDELNESRLVQRFRDLKHGLGNLFFEPSLLTAIQDTNLALRNRIHKLYGREERRIVAEYQRIFELEREVPVDTELDGELAQFREEIERFEKQLQRQEFKLEDLAQIRQRVRSLLPRLTAGRPELSGEKVTGTRPRMDSGEFRIAAAGAAAEAPLPAREEVLGEYFRKLVNALRDTNPDLPPERLVLTPEIFPLRLEAREVTAYRRFFGRQECDRELEQFVLEAAALRVRINEEAQEITSILDETSITGNAPVYARARMTCRTADEYVWRFNHVLHDTLLGGDPGVPEQALQLEILRMRLMRDYSGLWLLAYKPFLVRRPGQTLA
jgi:hypothetical protein